MASPEGIVNLSDIQFDDEPSGVVPLNSIKFDPAVSESDMDNLTASSGPTIGKVKPESYLDRVAKISSAESDMMVTGAQSDFVNKMGKGAMSGTAQIGQSVGTGLKYLGGRTGSKAITKLGEETTKGWIDVGKDYETPEDIEGSILEKPELLANPSWWAYNVVQTGVSMLPGMVAGAGVGGAAAKGVQVLGKVYKWTPTLVNRLMTLGYALPAGIVGGAQEGTSTYEEVLKRGGTEEEAARAMEAMTTASGILNSLSFGKMFEKLPQNQKSKVVNYIRNFIETGVTEVGTEYAEEPAEVLIKLGLTKRGMTVDEIKQQLKQGVNVIPAAFVTGGIGGFGGAQLRSDQDQTGQSNEPQPPPATPQKPKQKTVAEKIDKSVEKLESNETTPDQFIDEVAGQLDNLNILGEEEITEEPVTEEPVLSETGQELIDKETKRKNRITELQSDLDILVGAKNDYVEANETVPENINEQIEIISNELDKEKLPAPLSKEAATVGIDEAKSGEFSIQTNQQQKPGDVYSGKAYRVETTNLGLDAKTALDKIKFEADELGNEEEMAAAIKAAEKHGVDLSKVHPDDIVWVTRDKDTANKLYGYGEEIAEEQDIPKGSVVLSDIGEDGVLVLKGHAIKPAGEAASATVPAKQPWQMTQMEFYHDDQNIKIAGKVEIIKEKPVYKYKTTINGKTYEIQARGPLTGLLAAERLHKEVIKEAMSEGKPVPEEVLKDYHDLQRAEAGKSETTEKQKAPDLSAKSTGDLVKDMFALINDHIGERGSISTNKIDQTLYDKLKPYLAEIVKRAKAKALDVRAYLFGAVDSMPEGKAKGVYEAAARQYLDEQDTEHYNKLAEVKKPQSVEKKKTVKKTTTGTVLTGNYDTTGERPNEDTEYGSKAPERKFKKDLQNYKNKLQELLGYENESTKKIKDDSVSVNVAPAGGDGHILLWKPNSEYGIYISVEVDRGEDGDNLVVAEQVMYRATTKKDKWGGLSNQWIKSDISAEEFADVIKREVDFYDKQPDAEAIIEEARNAGHTEEEISDAIREGEKHGDAQGTAIVASKRRRKQSIKPTKNKYPIFINPENKKEYRCLLFACDIKRTGADSFGGSGWEWFGFEKESGDIYFGLVHGFETEWGSFSLSELRENGVHITTNPDDLHDIRPPMGWEKKETIPLTSEEKGAILKLKESEENVNTISQREANAPTVEDDRAGIEGSGSEVLQRAERGRETAGISGRKGHRNDSELSGRESESVSGASGAENIPGEPAKSDTSGQQSLGRDSGDVSRIQRPERGRDHVIEAADIERTGSWREATKTNLDVIELIKKLDEEKRQATPEEQKLLAKYVGWGSSELANNMFPGYAQYGEIKLSWAEDAWKPLVERLVNSLSEEEIRTAARSTQYAHYTSPQVIKSIYNAVNDFGFPGGKVVEPGMGTGHFFGLMPASMRGASVYTGIEMDGITAGIAQYLYPNQNAIHADYTKQKLPNNFFDLAIGNPPFSQTKILTDPDYKKLRLSLHDYFFVKTMDKVRPGGLMIFITSRYTMDKQTDKARIILNEKADLLGAIRLPQTAFKQNAGTEVVTDVLFFRKKDPFVETSGQNWLGVKEITIGDDQFFINEYFHDHPEMVLGTHSNEGKMRYRNEYTVKPAEGDIEEQFAKAAAKLPKNVYSIVKSAPREQEKIVVENDFNPTNKKEGGLYISDKGTVMITENGRGVSVSSVNKKLTSKDLGWLKDYVELRDIVKANQYDQLNDGNWEKSLETLKNKYNAFVKKHGRINEFSVYEKTSVDEDGNEQTVEYRRFKNEKILRNDVESPLVSALEVVTEGGEILEGPFLKGRTIKKPEPPQIKTVPDALAVSLDMIGHLDIGHISSLVGKPESQIIEQLDDLIFEDPTHGWMLADEYLSGNVVEKLAKAKAAAGIDPKYERNVIALLKNQPIPLNPADISINAGVNWIPIEYYDDFIHDVLGISDNWGVHYSEHDNTWTISSSYSRRGSSGRNAFRGDASEWSTPARGVNEIFTSVLNNATIKVVHTWKDDTGTHSAVDEAQTSAANDVAKKMRARFKTWIWEDSKRTDNLLNIYNHSKNTIVPRKTDGSHLTLPGVSLRFNLYKHQKNVIWRIIQKGNTYMAHAVGAGKTYSMVAAGMEQKRLGLIKKPLYVVPNHMLQQFSNEFQDLYPLAHIMVADEEKFHTTNRKRFVAQATLNNPDAIVMTHSSFGLLKMKSDNITPIRDQFIQDLRDALEELEEDSTGNKYRIKQMERRIEQLEQRFDSMIGKGDDVVTFEDMGVDFVFVDEAHSFRKLDFTTNRQAKGIDPVGSKKAMDLYIKTHWLESQNKGRSHVFASGTPITNTMGELYTLMRFFDEEEMDKDGIRYFDSWANHFGELASAPEMNAAGRYEIVERFSKFVNLPELMSRVRMFMDVLTSSQLGGFVTRPTVKNDKPNIRVTPPSPALKEYQTKILQPRIEESKAWKPSREQPGNPDPIINIITDGRLASIDLRFVVPGAKNDPSSKLNQYIDSIIESYKESNEIAYLDPATKKETDLKGSAIICFYNHGFGKMAAVTRGFDARAWMMKRLKEAGIPSSHVAWIDDYKTAVQKEAMYKEMRNGSKRILIGSAKKMGTGLNVQNRLKYLKYLDPPWYPSDVEQPLGRILRQGNQNKEITADYFATKGSYDATMWQMVTRKSKFIEDAFTGGNTRTMEDISETSLYELAAALASGDERAIKLAGLNADINNLENLRAAHYQKQAGLRLEREKLEINTKINKKRIKELREAQEKLPNGYLKDIDGTIEKKTYDERRPFGEAIIKKIQEVALSGKPGDVPIGTINNLTLSARLIPQLDTVETVDGKLVTKKGRIINDLALKITPQVSFIIDTDIDADTDPVGLVTKIVNQINRVDAELSKAEDAVEENQTELKKIEGVLGAPFEFQQELNEKVAEAAQIKEALTAEGNTPPHQPGGTTLDMGIDPTQIIENLRGLTTNIKEAMPYLEAAGQRVWSEGKIKYHHFRIGMRKFLGDLWMKYRQFMRKVWNNVRRKLSQQRGGWLKAENITPEQVEARARMERNLRVFQREAEETGLSLEDYLKQEGLQDAQISRLLKYAKEQPVEMPGYREVKTDEVLEPGAEIKMDFLSGKSFVKEEQHTGVKNAQINEEMEEAGQDLIKKMAPQGNEKMLKSAKGMVDRGDVDPRLLAQQIATKPRPLTAEEEFILMYDRMRIKNQLKDIYYQIEDAQAKEDSLLEDELIERQQTLREALDINAQAATHGGTETARSLQARTRMVKEDYSLEEILSRARIDKGRPLTDEERAKYEAMAREIDEANKKLAEYENRIAELEAQSAIRRLKNEKVIREHIRKQSQGKNVVYLKEELDKSFDSLAQRLKASLGGIHFNFNPADVGLLIEMAKNRIMAGVITPDTIVNEIYGQIHESYPEIEKRDIRDAISGYGRTFQLSKDEIDVQLRESKRLMRLISSYEDATAGMAPLRSGMQRDKISDEVRELTRMVRQAMREAGIDSVPGKAPEDQWKTSLDAVKTRLRNQIRDLEKQIATGEKTPKKIGIKYDEEAEILKAERDRLKEAIEKVEGRPEMSPEQKIKVAMGAVERSISEYERRITEKDLFPKRKESTTTETPELKSLRQKRDDLKALYKDMQNEARPKKTPEEIAVQTLKTRMTNRIEELEGKLAAGDFSIKPHRKVKLDEEGLTLRHKLDRAIYRYKQAQLKDQLARRSTLEKIGGGIAETANLMRSLKASMDLSAVFRQALVHVVSHPIIGARGIVPMLKAFKDDKYRFEVEQDIVNRPNYETMKEAGLDFTDIGNDLSAMEETFMSRLAEKVPGVAGSQRAYTTYLNKIRADMFDHLLATLVKKEGRHTPEEAKAIATFINEATGRGKLGAKANTLAGLNTVFFAPRLVASRFQLLSFHSIWKGSAATRKLILKEYARFVSGMALVYFLATLAGFDIEWDPRSSQFGKIRIGNTRIDPLGGLIQVIVFLSKEITGSKKTQKGRIVPLRESYSMGKNITDWKYGKKTPFNDDASMTLWRFIRSKLAPAWGVSIDYLSGENVVGDKVTTADIPKNAFAPMSMVDTYEAIQEHGVPEGFALGTLAALGIGIQTYDEKKKRD